MLNMKIQIQLIRSWQTNKVQVCEGHDILKHARSAKNSKQFVGCVPIQAKCFDTTW